MAAAALLAAAQGPAAAQQPVSRADNKIECYRGSTLIYASKDRSIAKFDAASRGLTLQRQWNYPNRPVVFYFYSNDVFCLADPS